MSFQYGRRRPHVCHLKRFQMFPSLSFFKGGHNLILFDFFECHDLRFSFQGQTWSPGQEQHLSDVLQASRARARMCVWYIYIFVLHILFITLPCISFFRLNSHTHKHITYTYACTITSQCRTKCRPLQGEDSPLMSLSVRLPTVGLGAEMTSVGGDYYRL